MGVAAQQVRFEVDQPAVSRREFDGDAEVYHRQSVRLHHDVAGGVQDQSSGIPRLVAQRGLDPTLQAGVDDPERAGSGEWGLQN